MSDGVYGGDFARKVIERLGEVVKERGKSIGQQWGTPVRAEALSREEQARLWNLPNPQADPVVFQQLVAAGQHNQAVRYAYPWREMLIGQGDIKTRVQRAQSLMENAARFQMQGGDGGVQL